MKLFTIILFAITYILMIALPKKRPYVALISAVIFVVSDAAVLCLYRHRLERSSDARRYDGHGRAVY